MNYIGICNTISTVIEQTGYFVLPFTVLLICACVVYFVRQEVFLSWTRLALWWIPLSMLLIFITPEYGGGLVNPIVKGPVAVFLSSLFIILSLLIVAYKYWRVSKRQTI